jgi:hypothetical protein
MDIAKLILEYTRVTVWPIIVVVILLVFSRDISEVVKKIQSFEAGPVKARIGGSGEEKGNTAKGNAPDIWFNILPITLSHSGCLDKAKTTLENNGFSEIGTNSGATTYGYAQQYVSAIWCSESPRLAMITVSGPSSSVAADKVSKLVRVFDK